MISIGSDHAGYRLKERVKNYLDSKNIEYKDCGTFSEESVDYPDYAEKVSADILSGKCEKGILFCGSGLGMSIAANKINGIRAALCSNCYAARMSRAHNDSNILTLGGRTIGPELAIQIIDTFLNVEFEGGRHKRRVGKINKLEEKNRR